jgi:hypothetical protein
MKKSGRGGGNKDKDIEEGQYNVQVEDSVNWREVTAEGQ